MSSPNQSSVARSPLLSAISDLDKHLSTHYGASRLQRIILTCIDTLENSVLLVEKGLMHGGASLPPGIPDYGNDRVGNKK